MNKETCFFYSRTNGCKHGLECIKIHPSASRSRVVVVKNMYLYPRNDPLCSLGHASVQIHVDLFYEDWFTEISLNYGPVRRIAIASNSCVQLLGNIYIEFESEADAARCAGEIGRRCYGGKKISAELGNCYRVDDGMCTDYRRGLCSKGDQCNFIHMAKVSEDLVNELLVSQELFHAEKRKDSTRCGSGNKRVRHGTERDSNPRRYHEDTGHSRRY